MRLACILLLALVATGLLSAQEYFPPGILGKTQQEHESRVAWYSRQLKALREQSLWELAQKDPKAEVYRFLWLRSVGRPVAVRIVVRAGGSGWINSRMTTGQGAYDPGHITRYGMSWLRKSLTQSFLAAIGSTNFWKMPTLLGTDSGASPSQSAQWIIEGVKDGQYHAVDRWSPAPDDPYRAVGLLALKLSRTKVRPADIY